MNEQGAICAGFEESVGGAVCEEVAVETWHVFCGFPGLLAGLLEMSLKVSYFWVPPCSDSDWSSCGFISLLSYCVLFPGKGS